MRDSVMHKACHLFSLARIHVISSDLSPSRPFSVMKIGQINLTIANAANETNAGRRRVPSGLRFFPAMQYHEAQRISNK
jgi:hypothetical protein